MFKNFICENHKCKKNMMKNFLHCAKCFKKFCCNNCINSHLHEFHEKTSKELPMIKEYNETNEINTKEIYNQEINDKALEIINENIEKEKKSEEPEYEIQNEIEPIKPKSLYIKNGLFLQEIVDDPHYNFENFELRRDQPLGKGAFGDVITAIHKQDGKKYAIKQVLFSYLY